VQVHAAELAFCQVEGNFCHRVTAQSGYGVAVIWRYLRLLRQRANVYFRQVIQ